VWNHGVAAAEWILGIAQWVVFWCWLWEPDVASVAAEMAGFQRFGDVFFNDNGAAGGVD
jgi:hypothetical protein